ncbi:MAG: glutathione S-transferase family protein [Pseudomonadota bacterium]
MTEVDSEKVTKIRALVDAANAGMGGPYKNKVINGTGGARPRFELYHSAPSLCSHKCRTTLAEKGVPYMSHDMSIMPMGKFIPQNYRPEYVRLRLQGAPDAKFADSYTGESSVTNMGFDPCVVPTLVDLELGRVVVDSRVICEYIDAHAPQGEKLIPDTLRATIEEQEALVDQAPHVAALYGAHPDGDDRPEGLRQNITGVHARKIRVLKSLIEFVGEDPELLAAYKAKIAKEAAAGEFMIDDEGMRETHRKMAAHVDDLARQLAKHDGQWVCGDTYTMADILWTCSIWRMQWLGFAHLWKNVAGRERVNEYLVRAFQRPAFRSAVVDWAGAHGPSHHVEEHSSGAAKRKFAMHMIRTMNWPKVLFGDPQIKLPPMAAN